MSKIDSLIKSRLVLAVGTLPFNTSFYTDIQKEGLSAEYVYVNNDKYCSFDQRWFRSPQEVEKIFIWLVKIGLVRREVDGQGLTSRIRLTPLGRNLIHFQPNLPIERPNLFQLSKFWLVRNCIFK